MKVKRQGDKTGAGSCERVHGQLLYRNTNGLTYSVLKPAESVLDAPEYLRGFIFIHYFYPG